MYIADVGDFMNLLNPYCRYILQHFNPLFLVVQVVNDMHVTVVVVVAKVRKVSDNMLTSTPCATRVGVGKFLWKKEDEQI